MAIKVVFIGNIYGGDDGIGPHLFGELKDHPELKPYKLLELGVMGVDLLSYVDEDDQLIIVDAVHAEPVGRVIVLSEEDLTKDLTVVSQHDFGIEQTASILKALNPKLKDIKMVGVCVQQVNDFSDELSDTILCMMPQIKRDVVKEIKGLV